MAGNISCNFDLYYDDLTIQATGAPSEIQTWLANAVDGAVVCGENELGGASSREKAAVTATTGDLQKGLGVRMADVGFNIPFRGHASAPHLVVDYIAGGLSSRQLRGKRGVSSGKDAAGHRINARERFRKSFARSLRIGRLRRTVGERTRRLFSGALRPCAGHGAEVNGVSGSELTMARTVPPAGRGRS